MGSIGDRLLGVVVLDETAHQSLLAAIDMAISRCIDAYNIASEADEQELAEGARTQVTELKGSSGVSAHPAFPVGLWPLSPW
jgi:hypothetical protein